MTCRLMRSPIPFVHVCGEKPMPAASAIPATLRAIRMPPDSTASGCTTSTARRSIRSRNPCRSESISPAASGTEVFRRRAA